MEELLNSLLYIPKYFKVITKADSTGASALVPMTLWPSQEHYIKNRTHRDIVVKNRQTGFSSGVMADNSHKFFTVPNTRMAVVTHNQETSEFLFQTITRFYNNLPDDMRPSKDWHSGTRIRLDKMDCFAYIDSAESKAIGIGHTLNIAHLSEVSRWSEQRARDLFAGISQTVPAGGFITMEATPWGRVGLFYEVYHAAKRGDINYKWFFYPWWWDISCVRDIQDLMTDEKAEKVANVLNTTLKNYLAEEKVFVEEHNLSPNQLAFRREKILELRDLFFQEYPESDIDCWLSNEIAVIDGMTLKPYLSEIKQGNEQGNLTTWKGVVGGHNYIVGVDVAAGYAKGDFSVASVLDVRNMEYVARLRGRMPPDLFAEQLYRLGGMYNEAEIGVERTGHGHSVLRVLLEKNYPNIYYHLEYDEIQGRTSNEPGWKTSIKTKPMMVTDLVAALRSHSLLSYSENLLQEASGLTWEGQQKVKTSCGGHDDEWDAVSIAIQLREQAPLIQESERPQVRSYAGRVL